MAYKSKYIPQNSQKYIGNINNIICRSSWERKYCIFLDNNKKIIKWSSEPFVIQYFYEVDKRVHRYFPDFYVERIDGKKFIIEIKPFKETKPPRKFKITGNYIKDKKKKIRYIKEQKTFIKNQNKWKAAIIFADKKKMEFKVLTEKELGI